MKERIGLRAGQTVFILLQTPRIRPVIDRVFPFEQAKETLDYLAQGRAKGKVVVQMR